MDLSIIGRQRKLFTADVFNHSEQLDNIVSSSRFLVVGGAGTIGQAVTLEIFRRNPLKLHVVDISENNMVELVREVRSTHGYISGDFRTFALDCGSIEFEALMNSEGPYDYIFNLSALKHPRSEKDPFTLMRMVSTNVLNTISLSNLAQKFGARKYFCVSTDKAANPVNMMGASKRIMELFLMRESHYIPVSMARFANVAFSDGSLLHGFNQRFAKKQPISAPNDVRRYFVTQQEAGQLCLLSGLLGDNRDLFYPKLEADLHLKKFSDIAESYLLNLGYTPYHCSSEEEARSEADQLIKNKRWPCYFFTSDTTGEKDYEEFFTNDEVLDVDRFVEIGVIKNTLGYDHDLLDEFLFGIQSLRNNGVWDKSSLLDLFYKLIPDFAHKETGKYLDQRM